MATSGNGDDLLDGASVGRIARGETGLPFWRRPLMTALAAALVVTVIAAFVALLAFYRVYVVPSGAMRPTIGAGTYVVVNATRRVPHNGDIVAFHDADWSFGSSALFLKRVLAMSGETISCCQRGAVVRDGTSLTEPYLATGEADPSAGFPPVTIPQGSLWLMGDNRANSADSRFHMLDSRQGSIPASEVVGTVVAHGSRIAMYLYVLARTAPPGVVLGLAFYVWRSRTARVQPCLA